ncbi:LysR family transcriptional regulator [Aestuariicella hydrocarbonica]|uniref:LysR family transcriptional regulator n=1 Tax=Pseudomaricurvus hydrocarbonicus TaxID=1470433 RepID=A0A9E5ML92_9GAMM|nr:LysR family transcriptional regulator [Aestuariicella hydrocarbonica]NHO64088.1 LysR family transcriptional regulator [Aestuariicella hydrocarbonica]
MNTELLRTFLEVSKTRHFGQAAENLCLTQSAVSFRIRQLEEIIGVPLFTRERNNILLTPSGDRLLPHAENILASWQLALQDVAVSSGQDIQLALGATSNLWDTFLQAILPKLAQQVEGLHIRTDISSPQELTRALLGGRLDMIVVLDPPKVVEVETIKIGHIELVCVANTPQARIEDMENIGHIFVDWGTAFNLQHARLFPRPVAPILHTGQSHIALEFLLSHGGSAFLPKALVTPYLQEERLFMMPEIHSLSRDVYAVYNSGSRRAESLRPIVDLLQKADLKPTSHTPR